ncbi:MAG: CpXC domain-containing protein [Chloroflexota bacterium]
MPFPALPTQVTCPRCRHAFVVEMRTILDVGQEPELKEQFLQGEVNYARCPQCGSGGVLSTPFLYHDPAKELLISHIPAALALPSDEQEKLVGRLVQAVMNSLPQEQRKGYFLRPKTALALEGLYDAILEAEGYSREALQRQRDRLLLINQLLANLDDDKTLGELIEQHRGEIDYEFLLIVSELSERDRDEGQDELSERVLRLRAELLTRVELAAPRAAPRDASYEDLIALLQETKPGAAWRQTIALNRPRLDYGFFQALTGRIEAAKGAGQADEADKLTDLRRRILEELDALERAVRAAEDESSLLIMTLSEAEDLPAAVRDNVDRLDDLFFAVLSRYMATAQAQKNEKRMKKLQTIMDTAIDAIEEQLPPEVRLVNRLARAEYPDGTNAVLEAHRGLLNENLLKTMDAYAQSLEGERGDPALAAHLKQVRAQIQAKMTILRA